MDDELSDIFDGFDAFGKLKEPDINCQLSDKLGIDKWFQELHLTDEIEVLKKIKSFLKDSNQYKIPIKLRTELLDKLYSSIFSLIGIVKPSFLNTLLPLNKKHKEDSELCILVLEEVIHTYSIILYEQINKLGRVKSFFHYGNKELATTIQCIIRFISQIILTRFELYQKTDELLWKKLYQLFNYSEKKKISDLLTFDAMLQEKTSIKSTMMQILLLAISDPHKYNQLQIYYIYKRLINWSKKIDIVSKQNNKNLNYSAICFFKTDLPTFCPNEELDNTNDFLLINTKKLSIDILQDGNDVTSGFLSSGIKKQLLKKLKSSWSQPFTRNYDRKEYKTKVKVVIGLKNVHYVLNNYKKPKWLDNINLTNTDTSINTYDYEQMLHSVHQINDEVDLYASNNIIHTFLTKNSSLNGLGLIWESTYAISVKIGDLIIISEEQSKKPNVESWYVGVIKQINNYYNQPLSIGIEKLSEKNIAVPVSIKIVNQYLNHRGLIIPNYEYSNESETLLTEPLTFKIGAHIELGKEVIINKDKFQSETKKTRVSLAEEIDVTPFFIRYKVSKTKTTVNVKS